MQVTKPGGTVVVGDPDWRSFQIDVTGAGAGGADAGVGGVAAEAGRRWGDHRRPPSYVGHCSSFGFASYPLSYPAHAP